MLRRVFFWAAGLILATPFVAAGLLAGAVYLSQPEIDPSLDLYALNRPPAFTFLDKDGNTAGHYGPHVGERVKLSELPAYVPAAFIAMEDQQFYQHSGIDPRAIVRALIADLKAGETVQGGSTITQQLVKILFLTPDRTLGRKIREVGGAWTLEQHLSKNEILELYLNRIYLGSGAYGVDGASRVYFGKSARELTLAEAAMLAALTRAPSTFTPRRDLTAAQLRSKVVLNVMYAAGMVSAEDVVEAGAHPAMLVDPPTDFSRAYYLDASAEEVRRLLPRTDGDLVVRTTFDPAMQDMASKTVADILTAEGGKSAAGQAALVSLSPDGAIRALVGGRDYAESQFNRATQARRQPGSAFKPFVYLAALEEGLHPWTVRSGGAVNIDGYRPGNYGGVRWGALTLENALVHSVNTIAVRVADEIGIEKVAAAARRLGITSALQESPSLALGTSGVSPLEMTGAYAAFANGGIKATPYSVVEIRNPQGRLLYRRPGTVQKRVIEEGPAEDMSAMLTQVVRRGTAREAAIAGFNVAGKTGTSSDWRDAWFVGYTQQYVTGVWVGNDDFTPMKRVTGGMLPAEIWNDFMRKALEPFAGEVIAETVPEPIETYPGDVPYGVADDSGRDYWGEHAWYEVPEPPPVPADAVIDSHERDVPYWRQEQLARHDAYYERRGIEPLRERADNRSGNPYEQEWYLREQSERRTDPYAEYRRDYADQPPSYAQPAERPRIPEPRVIPGPDGRPIYSMRPVGR